jgi:hypothetical protein
VNIFPRSLLFPSALILANCLGAQTPAPPADDLPDHPGLSLMRASSAPPSQSSSSFSTSKDLPGPLADDPATEERIEKVVSPLYPSTRPYMHRVVPLGMGPQPLTGAQKFEMSFRSRFNLNALGSTFFGAGVSHMKNGRPHYGSDKGGFGERLGAAEVHQFTESFFSNGLYPAAFHQDPHYYIMGPRHPWKERAAYSASRVVLTQNDGGSTRVNWSKLAGMASANALSNAYYPDVDRRFEKSAKAYLFSLGTSAITLEMHEFLPDLFHAIRHKRSGTRSD